MPTEWYFSNLFMMLVLLGGAAILMLLELVTPSFGILAAMGLLSMVGSIIYAFFMGPIVGFLVMLGCFVGVPLYIYAVVKYLPDSWLGKLMFLRKARDATNDATPQYEQLHEYEGRTGKAETTLRPSGVIRIDGVRINALAEREMIEAGETVKVIRSRGTDVIVRRADIPSGETGEGE
jgi:membrane-bound serine protease (ClpP class)